MQVNEKIALLRSLMQRHHLDAWLAPSADPHQSEYTAAHWKSREWLSGFSGSAGTLVVTAHHAGLWTDSRYFIQAEQQLTGTCIALHKQVVAHAPEHIEWLAEHLPRGSTIGLDGSLFSLAQLRQLEKKLQPQGIELRTDLDLIAEMWTDRPPLPHSSVFELPLHYAGASRTEKLNQIRQAMQQQGADAYLVSTLDDIAWTLNIRAADVDYNPVCISWLVVDEKSAHWFVDAHRIPDALVQKLVNDGIVLHSYHSIEHWLRHLPKNRRIAFDRASVNARLFRAITAEQSLAGDNLVAPLKAIKSEIEIAHIRHAMCKDGVALTHLLQWLEQAIHSQNISEYDVAQKIAELRAQQSDYIGESFPAIVGYQANGAIVHYTPDTDTAARILPEGILLIDCGGQYLHGTTDITRTLALGEPSLAQKEAFTAVLKGHIALASAWFPQGTRGLHLDPLARLPLWKQAKNYGHGTGHGVGYFLNVHEGPQSISPTPGPKALTAIQPGMLISNEPGFYLAKEYGIRIENLVLCIEAAQTDFGRFLRFETLSLCPIDQKLIYAPLLNDEEKAWLNDYHQKVWKELSPWLDEKSSTWLKRACQPVT